MDARDSDVWPHDRMWAQYGAGVGYAVAPQLATFAKNGSKLAQATWKAVAVKSEMNFTTIVSKVAQFGSCAQVDVFSEDGVANVSEMRCFRTGEED